MTMIDMLIIFGITLFVALGFRDGLFKKMYSLLGFWGGLILAIKFMSPFSEVIAAGFDFSTEVCLILAFFIIFLAAVVITNLIYRWFGQSATDTIPILSRIAGAFLGGFQGLVAISLVLIMFNILDVPSEDEQKEAVLYKKTMRIAPKVFDYSTQWIPSTKSFYEEIKAKIDRFNVPH